MYGLALLLLHIAPSTVYYRVLGNPIGEGGFGALTLPVRLVTHGLSSVVSWAVRRIQEEDAAVDVTDGQWMALEPLIGALPRRADGRGRPWRSSAAN